MAILIRIDLESKIVQRLSGVGVFQWPVVGGKCQRLYPIDPAGSGSSGITDQVFFPPHRAPSVVVFKLYLFAGSVVTRLRWSRVPLSLAIR